MLPYNTASNIVTLIISSLIHHRRTDIYTWKMYTNARKTDVNTLTLCYSCVSSKTDYCE